MRFVLRVLVATLAVLAAMLTDLPWRLRHQWDCLDEWNFHCFVEPVVEVWAVRCSVDPCLSFDAAPGSDVRLTLVSGDDVAAARAGERVQFDITDRLEGAAVLSWRRHALDTGADLSVPIHGPRQGLRAKTIDGDRAQLPVEIRRGEIEIWLSEPRAARQSLEKRSPTR